MGDSKKLQIAWRLNEALDAHCFQVYLYEGNSDGTCYVCLTEKCNIVMVGDSLLREVCGVQT